MANTSAPFGFSQYSGTGSLPTYEQVQMAISSSNTGPIFSNDPVMMSAGTTGVGTGLITQAYNPVTVVISGITFASGVATATITAITSGVPTSPNAWAAPVGSVISITGASSFATGGAFIGNFTVTDSTTTTIKFVAPTGTFSSTYTAGTSVVYVPVAGVFVGCKYLSVAQKRTVWSNYWPGSDANTAVSVTAYVVNDPNAQFVVQTANSNTTSTAVGVTAIGQNIGFNYAVSGASPSSNNGNTATGISTYFADQYTLTTPGGYQPLLPFRVVALANWTADGSNPLQSVNGNDYTSAYNRVVVAFNNAMLKQFNGI
jgi:hypothetical protein